MNRSYYVVYQNSRGGLETDELDFEYGEEVSQQTVYQKLKETHSGWYDNFDCRMVVSWSLIVEKDEEDEEDV